MQLSTSTFNEVVYYLENHEESLRIKKLIFCICKKSWENDIKILNNIILSDLIQELLHLKPSNEQLTFSVHKLVKTLNRSSIYTPLGKIIIDQVNRLYQSYNDVDDAEETGIIFSSPEEKNINESSELPINKIVANLENHCEKNRIKKMIFAVGKNQWENNINIIDAYGLNLIVLELRKTYKTKFELKGAFKRITEVINKKDVYLKIEAFILNQLEILYEIDEKKSKTETQIVETQIIHLDDTQVNLPQNLNSTLINSETQQSSPVIKPTHKDYNLFEIRLEIMQYTNPLRAKILLFSITFHAWDQTEQDWSTLKSHYLVDLLEKLLQKEKDPKEIETKLYNIANAQTDTDSYLQTASVIVQAIAHIF